MTTSSRTGAVLIAALLAACGGPGSEPSNKSLESASTYANGPTLPSVSVSGVTATSPVLRSTSGIAVSATVTPQYDTGSGPSSTTANTICKSNNNYCGTGNSAVTDQAVVTTTTVTVGNTSVTASAADFNSSAALTGNGTAFSGTLTTPTSGTDGTKTVTVTASVSEDVTTTITTETIYKACTSSKGVATCTTMSDTTTQPTSTTVTKTGSASATGSYVLDINPPVLTLKPDQAQPTVLQGGNKNIHNDLIGGSAGTAYTVTGTITGPDNYSNSASGTGNFGTGKDGIAPDKHDLVSVHVACDAPVGQYTATAVADTVDLGGNAFDQIHSVNYPDDASGGAVDTFEVLPGISLVDQTTLVSELPPSGDYAPMSCFTSGTSGRKITTFPGSLHLTATVNTSGPCAGFGTISGTVITLTVPAGFSFDTTGASPAAHVFVGPAAGGFDYHNPTTLTEVTGLIPKPKANGSFVTVDLSNLNLGQGPGVIPATDTIYVRAHVVFSGTSIPEDGTQYVFTTSTNSVLPGLGSQTDFQTKTLTKSSSCVNGN